MAGAGALGKPHLVGDLSRVIRLRRIQGRGTLRVQKVFAFLLDFLGESLSSVEKVRWGAKSAQIAVATLCTTGDSRSAGHGCVISDS